LKKFKGAFVKFRGSGDFLNLQNYYSI
jgi:hypothetical protein